MNAKLRNELIPVYLERRMQGLVIWSQRTGKIEQGLIRN